MSHGNTPICKNFVCLCQRAKTSCQIQNSLWKYNFDIDAKGQGHTEFMTVCDTSYHGDTPTCITEYDYAKGQKKVRQSLAYVCHRLQHQNKSKSLYRDKQRKLKASCWKKKSGKSDSEISCDIIGDNIHVYLNRSPSQMSIDRKRQSWHWFLLHILRS